MHHKYIIGIDEAGRGPLAGPVSVGVVLIPTNFVWENIPGVNDSKQLAEKKREAIYAQAVELKNKGELFYAVYMESAESIDTVGIVPSVKKAMVKALAHVLKESGAEHSDCFVKLDGSLKAPEEFLFQETIIQGDSKEKVIGLASILAKVTRDRYMVKVSKQDHLAQYVFETHKGYGTKLHRALILKNGLSDMHRKSFCRKLI